MSVNDSPNSAESVPGARCTCDAFTIHASSCPFATPTMTEAERLRDAIATLADEWERRNVWLAWDVRDPRGGHRPHNENGATTLRALLRETL